MSAEFIVFLAKINDRLAALGEPPLRAGETIRAIALSGVMQGRPGASLLLDAVDAVLAVRRLDAAGCPVQNPVFDLVDPDQSWEIFRQVEMKHTWDGPFAGPVPPGFSPLGKGWVH